MVGGTSEDRLITGASGVTRGTSDRREGAVGHSQGLSVVGTLPGCDGDAEGDGEGGDGEGSGGERSRVAPAEGAWSAEVAA